MATPAPAHAHAPRSRLKTPTNPLHTHMYPRAQQAAAIRLRLRRQPPRDIWRQTGVPPAAQKAILLHHLVKKRERAERGYRRLRALFRRRVRGEGVCGVWGGVDVDVGWGWEWGGVVDSYIVVMAVVVVADTNEVWERLCAVVIGNWSA